jgi:AcrR family transcriptional regulator
MIHLQTDLPRKQRERLARTEEILDAARQVFSERGFARATLDEIAEVAEYGKGTIYNYFNSKEDLFVGVILRGIQRFRDYLELAIRERATAREKLETYVDASFSYFAKNREFFNILELERNNLARSLKDDVFMQFLTLEREFIQYLSELFEHGINSNEFKKLNSQMLAESIRGLVHAAIIHIIRTDKNRNLKEESEFIKKIFFDGVANTIDDEV